MAFTTGELLYVHVVSPLTTTDDESAILTQQQITIIIIEK